MLRIGRITIIIDGLRRSQEVKSSKCKVGSQEAHKPASQEAKAEKPKSQEASKKPRSHNVLKPGNQVLPASREQGLGWNWGSVVLLPVAMTTRGQCRGVCANA